MLKARILIAFVMYGNLSQTARVSKWRRCKKRTHMSWRKSFGAKRLFFQDETLIDAEVRNFSWLSPTRALSSGRDVRLRDASLEIWGARGKFARKRALLFRKSTRDVKYFGVPRDDRSRRTVGYDPRHDVKRVIRAF